MRLRITLSCAALLAVMGFADRAAAVNICQTPKLTCATTMPVAGYCECTARGATEDGTVVAKPAKHRRVNATAGGCGAEPNAPGCR